MNVRRLIENMPISKIYIIIFASIIIIWGAYCFCFGIGQSTDTLEYSSWANVLISKSLNINAYLKSVNYLVEPCLYLGFISLAAFTKIIFGVFWQNAIVVINILLGAFLCVILANLVYLFTKNKIAACFAAFLYIFNPEIALWSRYPLGDISFMFIVFFLYFLVVKSFLIESKGKIVCFFYIIIMLFLCCFYRPTGLVMIPIIALAFCLGFVKKEIQWMPFLFCFFVFLFFLILLHALVIKNYEFWPFEFGRKYLGEHVVANYQKGVIITNRPYAFHQAPVTFGNYVIITLDKFAHFFYFTDKTFKLYHKVINYIYFPLLYVFFIFGVRALAKKKYKQGFGSLVGLAIIVIICFGIFHAFTAIDHDWRFRLPVFPYLIFIAGLGLNYLLRFCKNN